VTFNGDAYPSAEITGVKWLLFDANQALVGSGDGVLVTDGQYQVTLPKDVSAKLVAGSNKLEVVVTSLLVAIPTFGTLEFVTTQ